MLLGVPICEAFRGGGEEDSEFEEFQSGLSRNREVSLGAVVNFGATDSSQVQERRIHSLLVEEVGKKVELI